MEQLTLQGYHNRLDYLLTEGTLEEVLEFLGLQYFDGSREEGNENRDVYEFIDKGVMAIEVLLNESKVRFWSELSKWVSPESNSFWYLLFVENLRLLRRLIDLLEEEYSYLGSLSYELRLDGVFEGFKPKHRVVNSSENPIIV